MVVLATTTGDEIRDAIARFTAPLLAVRTTPQGEVVRWAASGTLVNIDGAPCVLTAHHVAARLRRYDLIGIGVARGPHRYAVNRDHVRFVKVGKAKKGKESEGPDLAVLILPRMERGNIDSQAKAFWNLDKHRSDSWPEAQTRGEAVWAAAGVPAERSKVGTVSFIGGLVGVSDRVRTYERDGFHYIDLSVRYIPPANPPQDFGGMSGGGLWLLHTEPSKDGNLVWKGRCSLAGVVFFQTDREGDQRWLRCHGPEDVYGRAYEAVKNQLRRKRRRAIR